jgi:hypothetical protein
MVLAALLVLFGSAWAAQDPAPPTQADQEAEKRLREEELLQKLANPLAALASLKLTLDMEYHIGPDLDGHRSTWTLQPTIPLHLGDQWNLISRSALPVIYQEDVAPGAGSQFGIGDLTEALYLAAVQPGKRGWIVGVGPVARIPTGQDDLLTMGKWAVGPSAAAVKQYEDFTVGVILSQFWSVGGSEKRADISLGTVEPFVTYRAEGLWNLSLHVPFSRDFNAKQWIIPATLTIEKLVSFQRYPITLSFGARYWADGPDSAPHDLGFQFSLTFVFPN